MRRLAFIATLSLLVLATAPALAGKKHKFFRDASVVNIQGAVDTSPPQPNAFDLIGNVQSTQRCRRGRAVNVHITSAAGDTIVPVTTDADGKWRARVDKPVPPFDLTAEVLRLRKKRGVCRAATAEDRIHYP